MDQKQRRALLAQTNDIQDRLNEYGPGRPGGPLGWAPARKGRPTGNSSAAIISRLRRDHPELHQLVWNAELTPHRAAVAAGFLKKPGRKPRRPVIKLSASALTPLQEMELWLGPSHHGAAFASEEERGRLWTAHRERLMRWWGQEGTGRKRGGNMIARYPSPATRANGLRCSRLDYSPSASSRH